MWEFTWQGWDGDKMVSSTTLQIFLWSDIMTACDLVCQHQFHIHSGSSVNSVFSFQGFLLNWNASLSHAVFSTWMSHNLTVLWPGVCISLLRVKLKSKLNCTFICHEDIEGSGSRAVLSYLSARWSSVVTFSPWLRYLTESVPCTHCVGPRTSLAVRNQTTIPLSFSP